MAKKKIDLSNDPLYQKKKAFFLAFGDFAHSKYKIDPSSTPSAVLARHEELRPATALREIDVGIVECLSEYAGWSTDKKTAADSHLESAGSMSAREAAIFGNKKVSRILEAGIQGETDYHIIKEIRDSMDPLVADLEAIVSKRMSEFEGWVRPKK